MQFRNRHLAALSGSYAKQFLSHLAPLFCDKEILSGTHPIPLQQREIASILSVTPEHFSTILDRLEKEGMIVRWKRSVYLGPAATKMLIQDTA
jgi:DNA-binding MarR family transcriptional regulator